MKKKTAKILKWIGNIILCIGVGLIILKVYGKYELGAAQDKLRAANYPMELSKVLPKDVEDKDNAAWVYSELAYKLRNTTINNSTIPEEIDRLESDLNEADVDQDIELKKELEQEFAQLLNMPEIKSYGDILQKARIKKYCQFDVALYLGYQTPMLHLSVIDDVTKFILANIKHNIENINIWDQLSLYLNSANALKSEVFTMSQGSRLNTFFSSKAIFDIKSLPPIRKKQYDDLILKLAEFRDAQPLITSLHAERLMCESDYFDGYIYSNRYFDFEGEHPLVKAIILANSMFIEFDHAVYLGAFEQLLSIFEQSYHVVDFSKEERYLTQHQYALLSCYLLPPIYSNYEMLTRAKAHANVTEIGLACLYYRQEKGVFPERIEQLDTDNIIDPFTGDNLIFKSTANSFTICSVGKNQKIDDVIEDNEYFNDNDDTIWNYTNP
ncbi:MAG: hypothetical protein HQL32_04415 [Planctomycetes bacterium]|nr:hypothetical protein [Planctomycetota bacterium]